MNGFILHLQGPMMSFGDTGFGQLRDVGRFPSRSAVLGIIAAALGIQRGDTDLLDLHAALRVHVASAHEGALAVDYHTVKPSGYEEDALGYQRRALAGVNSVQTYRGYHHDAHFVALIEGEPTVVAESRAALRNPCYTGFLGRRGCPPATPLLPEDAVGEDLVAALGAACTIGYVQRLESQGKRRKEGMRRAAAYLDGDHTARPADRTAVLSYRRDLLVAVPRSYVNRPVTQIMIDYAIPPRAGGALTNEEVYDAVC